MVSYQTRPHSSAAVKRKRREREASSLPIQRWKQGTLPRGVPTRGCTSRQQELIPPLSSLGWTHAYNSQRKKTLIHHQPRGSSARQRGTRTRPLPPASWEDAATGQGYPSSPKITQQKCQYHKYYQCHFIMSKIAEPGVIWPVVRYLQQALLLSIATAASVASLELPSLDGPQRYWRLQWTTQERSARFHL